MIPIGLSGKCSRKTLLINLNPLLSTPLVAVTRPASFLITLTAASATSLKESLGTQKIISSESETSLKSLVANISLLKFKLGKYLEFIFLVFISFADSLFLIHKFTEFPFADAK